MPTFARRATISWKGSLLEGAGQATAGSGAFALPVSFPRRIGDAQGVTSPEELIAAAHATCFAMVVTATIGKMAGVSMQGSTVTCTVTADKSDAGIKIVSSSLEVVAEGLSGMDAATFATTARDAEGKCPVSNALRGSIAIDVRASVK
jgi:osmotically inducible protein OsmC